MLDKLIKSVLEQDTASVVICDMTHTIVYMNPAAKINYAKYGGEKIIGTSLFDWHKPESNEKIRKVVNWFAEKKTNNKIFTFHNSEKNKDVYMIALRDENGELIGYYEKHEFRNPETDTPYNFNK